MGLLSAIKGVFHGKTVEKAAAARRRFDGAAVDRFTAGWIAENNAIDTDLKSDLDRLRQRSRDLAKNNDYVRYYLKMVEANIVGPKGFQFQAQVAEADGKPDAMANDAIEAAFAEWSRRPEVSNRFNLAIALRTMAKCAARDGEVIIRHVRQSGINRFGYAFQLIDIARLDTGYSFDPGNGNTITMGVERDTWGRPVAYHLRKSTLDQSVNAYASRERIPASEITHAFVPDDPGQTRGYPWAHAVIKSLHDLGEYNKSALIAARKGADTLGFFVSPNGEPPIMDGDDNGDPISVSVPGQYDTLPEGYDFRAYESQYPSATYGEFVKAILRRIATGLGVSYNSLANDLEGVNYSSIRSGVLSERDQWMVLQDWFIDAILEPIFAQWLNVALLNGAITQTGGSALPLAKRDKFSAHLFTGRRWAWVDPLKDIEASRLAIKTGVSSPQMIGSQLGVDVDDVIKDLARFEEYSAGIAAIDLNDKTLAAVPVKD